MSDSSTQSRRSGSGGQRRSGSGRRRNNNRNRNRSRNRANGDGGGGGDSRDGGGPKSRRQGPGRRREPKPVPLTWWQKLLKSIGLYKEPVRPPRKRKSGEESADGAETPQRVPKTGTRVAKTSSTKKAPEPKPVDSTRLYLGNLSYDAAEHDLEDLFKGVGAVRNVEIVYNRSTHKSKGYGFIEMATIDEARRAVEVLHDQPFMGRKMVVSGANSRGPDDDDNEEQSDEAAA